MLRRLFTDHPASVGETYFQHLGQAWSFSAELALAAVKCFLHGLLPCLFVREGSEAVDRLHRRMVTHRDCRLRPGEAAAE